MLIKTTKECQCFYVLTLFLVIYCILASIFAKVTSEVDSKFKSAPDKTSALPMASDVSPAPLIETIPAAAVSYTHLTLPTIA